MTAKMEMVLSGPVDHLRLVWQAGETLLESVPFDNDPEGTRYNVLLAIQEMLTNVLRHAYQGRDGIVKLELEAGDDGFRATLADRGEPFDPLAHDYAPCLDGEEMPDDSGGYGILIARTVMDSVEYERADGWNRLSMFKSAVEHAITGTES